MPMHDCPECGAICDCRNEDACEHYRSGSCESLAGYIHDASVSDDLEKRLRDAWKLKFSDEALGLFTEAADRITHLEAKNEAMETILNACTDGTDWVYGQVPDELARLRSENEALTMILNLCTEGTDWTYAQVPDEIAALRAALKGADK